MWRCALTKCCCLLALGWTSASMCTRCCWAGKSKRLGPFGIQCSKWCTWELTHPHQYCNPRTCPPSAVCHVARHHVLGVRTGGGGGVPVPVHWDMDPQSRLRSRSAFGGIQLGPLPCPSSRDFGPCRSPNVCLWA